MKGLIVILMGLPLCASSVSGRLTNALTHEAVAGAHVAAGQASAVSDSAGVYRLRDLPAGHYSLQIVHPGFASESVFTSPDHGIDLKDGEDLMRNYEMQPEAVIRGRVVDHDSGKPLKGLQVNVAREDYGVGVKRYIELGEGSITDRDGQFSLNGLLPGEYALEVMPTVRQTVGPDDEHAADAKEADQYGHSYFPGVPAPELAAPLLLSAGERRDVEFAVRKGGLSDVVATLELPDTARGLDFSVLVERESPGSWSFAASGKVRGGQFRLRNFSPGTYGLIVYTDGDPKWFADYTLEVGGKPETHISVPVERPLELSGSVRAAKDAGELPEGALAGVKVSLNPVKRISVVGESNSADITPDGNFKIAGVYPGWYFVSLSGLPKGWGLVEERYKNEDAMNAGISLDGAMADTSLVFFVSPKLASLSVRVRDREDQPVAGAKVVLVPEKMPELFSPWALRSDVSDAHGGASFAGLAPGRYKPVLLKGAEAKRERDIELLRTKAAQVDAIEVRGGQGASVSVRN